MATEETVRQTITTQIEAAFSGVQVFYQNFGDLVDQKKLPESALFVDMFPVNGVNRSVERSITQYNGFVLFTFYAKKFTGTVQLNSVRDTLKGLFQNKILNGITFSPYRSGYIGEDKGGTHFVVEVIFDYSYF